MSSGFGIGGLVPAQAYYDAASNVPEEITSVDFLFRKAVWLLIILDLQGCRRIVL